MRCLGPAQPIGSPPPPPSPYKVGSNEAPFCYLPSDVTPPELLAHSDPVFTGSLPENYPTSVFLAVFVGTEGQPLSIIIGRAEGYGLDDAAIDEVKKWRWHPARKNGNPVAVRITLQIKLTRVETKT